MQDFSGNVAQVNTRKDFIEFVELLVQDLRNNPDDWANRSLDSYLESIASWTEDMDGYYQNMDLPIPQKINWKVFANILVAAKMYE